MLDGDALDSDHTTALGPHDLALSSIGAKSIARIIDELRVIRGALLVDAYLR